MAITPQGIVTINGLSWNIYEKSLDKITKMTVDSVQDFIPKLFTTTNKNSKRITERTFSGIPEAETWNPNGESIPVTAINSRWQITADNGWIAQRVAYTKEQKQFDLYDVMNAMAADLGNSIAVKRQKAALARLCGGFSTVWNTEANEYLFTASHYLDPRYSTGTVTYSNLVAGAPSVNVLKEALALLTGTPDDMGNPTSYMPKFILCHPDYYLDWMMIVGDARGKADTADNTINPFQEYGLSVVPCPWITTSTYWFLFSNKHGLVWNDVIKFKSESFNDDKTKVTYHDAYSCYTNYVRDWRGIVAGTGVA